MLFLPDAYIGHAAGITTSILWTGTSLLFTAAGRRIGPTAVNATRIMLAIVLLGATHWCWAGAWIPEVTGRQVVLLALSGLIGLSLGDQALFTAFVDIGPRLSMLIMTSAPLFAALFGWLALGETLSGIAWLGIALTVGGVAWVVVERPQRQMGVVGTRRARGITLAFVAAACQAGGLLLSKQGMGHGWLPESERLDPQAATLVRVFFAGLGMVPIVYVYWLRERKRRSVGTFPARAGSVKAGLLFAFGGSLAGLYLGVWMSLVASDRVAVGIAQTLCSLPPVFILPFARLVYKEHVSARAIVGAFVAVAGVALLFWPAR